MENNKNTRILIGLVAVAALAAGSLYYSLGDRTEAPMGNEEPSPSGMTEENTELNGEPNSSGGGTMDGGSASSGNGPTTSSEQDTSEENDLRKPTIPTNEYTVYHGFTAEFEGASEPVSAEVGEVVVGYEWEAMFPSPLFATVSLPEWDASGSDEYTVEVWNDDSSSYEVLGKFRSGVEITFPREGFYGGRIFKVTGIDPNLRICPGDRSFNWNVSFTFESEMGLIRTPITQALPAGETCTLR
jgi:hypothetical protein